MAKINICQFCIRFYIFIWEKKKSINNKERKRKKMEKKTIISRYHRK